VATKMSGVKKMSLFVPSPDNYVRAVLKKVGVSEKCFGYWPHELQGFCISFMPEWFLKKGVFSFTKAMRERALRKRKAKSS
uniref:hypothetical protein n=1 Tax=Salmonella sp. s54412 TaxID=3160128 RepID=UPI0037552293